MTVHDSDLLAADASRMPGPWIRASLSAVTILLLSMIVWCNLPSEVPAALGEMADSHFSPDTAWRIRYAEWLYRYAAHVGGLDSRWQMYGGQSRFNWRYIIMGHYSGSDRTLSRVLPLPRQSERTWFQETFADYREAKFLLNIYNDRLARETYARYLARQYSELEGIPVSEISYTLCTQYILPPLVAVQEQRLLEPDEQSEVIDVFDVRSEQSQKHEPIAGVF